MTPLERFDLNRLTYRYGEMTSVKALELALQAEQYARDCGPFDIAFRHFKQQQLSMESYALLLEKVDK